MGYPKVMDEFATVEAAIAGRSLSRYGDGELRLALGGSSKSQVPDLALMHELRNILRGPSKCLVCIPRQGVGPKAVNWSRYADPRYVALYGKQEYGSAFITRPDSTPHIDTQEYWDLVRKIWVNKDVTLVVGTDYGSLRERDLKGARNLKMVFSTPRNAYPYTPEIMDQIGSPSGPILMCLGATATILAERLARKNLHAIDLGHIGRFMHKFEGRQKALEAVV